jgi:hypothetical protein
MKKTLLIAGALLCLGVSMASAQGGINLSWNDCGPAGQPSQTFACNTNGNPPHTMIGSAVSPNPIDLMVAAAMVLDLQTNQPALTPWWNMDTAPAPPGCRTGSLSASFDFSLGPFTCGDIWGGGATGGSNYISQFGGKANHGRIRLVCAVPAPIAVDNSTENYYFKVTINNAKTAGTGNCVGCLDGACIVFNSLELDQNPGVPGGNTIISNPLGSQFVIWQSGGGSVAGGCPQATPTNNKTWGSVKSLYR